MTPGPQVEPRPHWWEASALTTAPSVRIDMIGFTCGMKSKLISAMLQVVQLLLLLSDTLPDDRPQPPFLILVEAILFVTV